VDIINFSVGYCCKVGIGFAGYYKAVEECKDDKDRYKMVVITHYKDKYIHNGSCNMHDLCHVVINGFVILMMICM